MNARWQRAVVFGSWLALIAWLAWQWPRSPAHALAGWALAWVVYGLVQALPFVFMWRANRHEPVPRPRLAQLLHAWGAEALHACVVFGWRQPFCEHAEPDWLPEPPPQGQATRRGVVLLHGFLCNRGFWLPWMRLLRARGHAYVAPTLEPAFGSIDDYAAAIDAAVRRVAAATGMPPVIIGHSMGGLAARAWLRAYGGKRDEKRAPQAQVRPSAACTASSRWARRTAAPGAPASRAHTMGHRCASAIIGSRHCGSTSPQATPRFLPAGIPTATASCSRPARLRCQAPTTAWCRGWRICRWPFMRRWCKPVWRNSRNLPPDDGR